MYMWNGGSDPLEALNRVAEDLVGLGGGGALNQRADSVEEQLDILDRVGRDDLLVQV